MICLSGLLLSTAKTRPLAGFCVNGVTEKLASPSSKLFLAYLAVLVWAPLPFGSNRSWAYLILCVLIFAVALATVVSETRMPIGERPAWRRLKPYRPVILVFAAIPIWTTIQSLSLPASWVSGISPNAALAWQAAGVESSYSISLQPDLTRKMALLGFALWVYFVLTLVLVDSMDRLRQLLGVIVLCGVGQALYGSFMTLSGLEYGFLMEKTTGRGVTTGTFINRNHLAGFLELSLAAGIGLLVATLSENSGQSWRSRLINLTETLLSPKARVRIYLAIMVIALVLTRSRTGNTAFFVSVTGCGLLMLILQRRLTAGALVLFASLLLVDAVIVGQWFGFEEVVERLENTSLERETRDEVVRDSLPLLQDYSLAGTGAGTYSVTFPAYRSDDVNAFYDHAHNDYIEFASTLGLIGLVPLGTLVGFSLFASVTSLYRRQRRYARGAAFASTMAIVSLGIHSATDFNLQIPANALLMVVMLAIAHLSRGLKKSSAHSSADPSF